jgi:hypothetical protein
MIQGRLDSVIKSGNNEVRSGMDFAVRLHSASCRTPGNRDYLFFYLLLPLIWAFWLGTSGIRLVSFMSVGHGYLYMSIHCLAAWWAADMGTRLSRQLLVHWQPPLWVVLTGGWLLTVLPMTLFYYWLTNIFAQYYPAMAPSVSSQYFEWTLAYPFKLMRGSFPWLCIWILAVYGYRLLGGVDWYGYPHGKTIVRQVPMAEPPAATADAPPRQIPEFLRRSSRLPLEADIQALKAAEHYVQIWSASGTDMIRYRFKDAIAEMPAEIGLQVHRSWWINPSRIARTIHDGHRLQLKLENGLQVPVSRAYRAAVVNQLRKQSSAKEVESGNTGAGH